MALLELVEPWVDGDLGREMLPFAADRIMQAEVETRTGAARRTRSPLREVQRHGYSLPNDATIIRLVGAIMLETNNEGTVARRCMTVARENDNPNVRLPAVVS